MKKILAMCLSATLALSVACSSGGSKDNTAAQAPTATEATVSHTVTFYDGETYIY